MKSAVMEMCTPCETLWHGGVIGTIGQPVSATSITISVSVQRSGALAGRAATACANLELNESQTFAVPSTDCRSWISRVRFSGDP